MEATSSGGTQIIRSRLDSLTGARFVAALAVFLYHASQIFPADGVFGSALSFIGRDGGVGVDFFFVLSGFVLTWSWRPGGSVRAFYRRRFARIAPAYWVALVYGLAWVVFLYRDPVASSLRAIPAVLGLQAWFPDPAVHFAANGVEWSVSAELFFYALFPLLIAVAAWRAGRAVLVVTAVLLGAVAPAVLNVLVAGDLSGYVVNILPILRLGEFVCGILLALVVRAGWRIPISRTAAGAVFLVCYVALPMAPPWVPQRALFLAAIVLVIGSLAQADVAGSGSLLSARIPVRLGVWSYCFYLVHQMTAQIMLFVCAAVIPGAALGPIWLLSAFGASLGIAAVLYRFVEHPMEQRLRVGRAERPSAAPMGAAGAA